MSGNGQEVNKSNIKDEWSMHVLQKMRMMTPSTKTSCAKCSELLKTIQDLASNAPITSIAHQQDLLDDLQFQKRWAANDWIIGVDCPRCFLLGQDRFGQLQDYRHGRRVRSLCSAEE